MNKTSISVTLASGVPSGNATISQLPGELVAIVFSLPTTAPAAAQYRIYETAPEITLLDVSGQQIADRDDSMFNPRRAADSDEGETIGGVGGPFPVTIPLYSQIRMDIIAAVAGTYTAYLFYK